MIAVAEDITEVVVAEETGVFGNLIGILRGAFLYGGKDMKKCTSCIWVHKINEGISMCPFLRCPAKDGWVADKKDGKKE